MQNSTGRPAAGEAGSIDDFKYRAFVSYSHKDIRWANWLHKALETYRPPKKLIGRDTPRGTVPSRLGRVFRDRDELPTATDLGRTINQALTESACQIVICSPNAAQSKWVNEEILSFKRLGGQDRIFCVIVDGEPNASSVPGQEHLECFPQALRYKVGPDGQLTDEPTEPIAADARPGKDGKANAKLKLISGMLGVGFDDLKQREHQRRQRRLIALAAAMTIGMVFTTTLATVAYFARIEAERQAETARRTTDFLVGLFAVSDPGEARGNTITAREILEKGVQRVRLELDDQPAVQATLMDTMGTVYRSLGLYSEASVLLDDALATRRAILGNDDPEVAKTLAHLAEILSLQAEYDRAEPMYREALNTQRDLLGNEALEVADTLAGFGDLLTLEGRFEEAEVLLRESLTIRRLGPGAERLDLAMSIEDLGMNLYDQGEYEEAEALLRESIAMRREDLDGSPHPDLAGGLNNLGIILLEIGDFAGAQRMYEEALAMNRELLDENHPTIAVNINNLAVLAHSNGDYGSAERYYREVIDMRTATLGADHPDVADVMNNLAFLFYDQGVRDEALALARDSVEIYRRLFPGDHPDLAAGLTNVGGWLTVEGNYAEAEPMLVEAYAMRRRLFGDEHIEIALGATALAQLYLETGRYEQARTLSHAAVQTLVAELSAEHWRTAWASSVEGASLGNLAQFDVAESTLLDSLGTLREGPGSGARIVYIESTLKYLANLYAAWGRPARASEYLAELERVRAAT
jgi:tetratricopeptide (TPR) repeat protein